MEVPVASRILATLVLLVTAHLAFSVGGVVFGLVSVFFKTCHRIYKKHTWSDAEVESENSFDKPEETEGKSQVRKLTRKVIDFKSSMECASIRTFVVDRNT